jgi:hypothetical protein
MKTYEPTASQLKLQREQGLSLSDLKVLLAPPGTICFNELCRAYKQSGHTDAIIKQVKWNHTVHANFKNYSVCNKSFIPSQDSHVRYTDCQKKHIDNLVNKRKAKAAMRDDHHNHGGLKL